jgi:two-component system LytT family response regulator
MTPDSSVRVTALLVDDEPLARRELRRLLAAHPHVTIVGEASNVDEAAARVAALEPDLLFLDIQMPGGTGFDLLARLENPPRVVFTTAYDQHAVRAFEVNALDYLLKPVEPERLASAIARLSPKPLPPASARLDRLFIRDGERCWFVPLAEVRLLESDGNYTRLYWKVEQPMLGRSLIHLEERIDGATFFRANRRQILNLSFIGKVHLGIAGGIDVELEGGPIVEISRRQARLFKERTGS